MNNCYRIKCVRCAKINKAQSFNNGGAKLKEEEFHRERERERELCDGEENATLNKLITDTVYFTE